MKVLGSVASVLEAVREDVDAEVARIRRETEDRERSARDAAAGKRIELQGRTERLGEERRRAAELLAREDWADRREALEQREAFVAEACRQGLERLAQGSTPEDRAEVLKRLIVEAVETLPAGAVEIAVGEGDAALLTGPLLADLERRAGRRMRLSADRLAGAGGCVVRTDGGRASFDNTFEARSRRFETAWRTAVAEVHGP